MKKILLFTGIIALALTSCKKEETPVNPATPSLNEQAASLIKKADNNLYNQIYTPHTQKVADPLPDVVISSGAFVVIDGNPDDGTCLPSQTICFIDVIFNKVVTNGGGNNGITVINSDYSDKYDGNTTALLLLNSKPIQLFSITSLNVSFVQGTENVSWTR
jgi:hypothetical protein